jgi:Fe-S cluster biogenesis protein NfuA
MVQSTSPMSRYWWKRMAEVDKQFILESVGPVQAILDAHDGVVNVIDTTDGVIMISLEGGCTGCASTPMTAMQIYYSLMKLEMVNDVAFVNGELPPYMRAFIDDKLGVETTE